MSKDSFGAGSTLTVGDRKYRIFRLDALSRQGFEISRLPYSIRILLENLLRTEDGVSVSAEDVERLARWNPAAPAHCEIAFTPARVLLQDFTGVPAIVDLAAMRDAMAELGGDPGKINPVQPVELVIDHSIQVDAFGTPEAFETNLNRDYERNAERYGFLRWGQQAFDNFRVVPPNNGIVHQVNLEYLARVVFASDEMKSAPGGVPLAYPDTCVGTDSHTPMVNGLGVLAWGVGGIEAEAAMLGQSVSMLTPEVIGFRLEGRLGEGVTATDLVLTITEMLRKKGVVGKFVEFYGSGIASLSIADRATIGNMSPEYGVTCAIFPPDATTLDYLRFTGRNERRISLVEAYMKEQGLFHGPGADAPEFTDTLQLDLSSVEPSVAGPSRPQDRISLFQVKEAFAEALPRLRPVERQKEEPAAEAGAPEGPSGLGDGAVVIAAITSCTNTSNPSVMLAAGLLAKKAVERGLSRKPWVKTSLAPGSKVVTRYFEKSGLTPYLDRLGFTLAGYGCTTCIGNSGPLPEDVSQQVNRRGLVVASVLSGNRNFEGRIHPEVRANFLMSPPLVVAYALVGRMDWDPQNEPLGTGKDGEPIYLRDLWPSSKEIEHALAQSVQSDMFRGTYERIFQGGERWDRMDVPAGKRFDWPNGSTYIRRPPYFEGMRREAPTEVADIRGARALAVLGDSVTTDHISPAGSIKQDSPAGRYLKDHGVRPAQFNSYGSRRGNHEVMVRGTFANVRIRNRIAPGTEGGYTTCFTDNEVMSIYDASVRYAQDGIPLCVLAGAEYGSGSSRDWAAKGPGLQGVRFVIAESYERIHRSNLLGMGVLPLQFISGEGIAALGLSGKETFDVLGLHDALGGEFAEGREVTVHASDGEGATREFRALVRIDTPQELLYYRNGGILQYVLRQLLGVKQRFPGSNSGMLPELDPRSHSSQAVDQGSWESFPASDPPAY